MHGLRVSIVAAAALLVTSGTGHGSLIAGGWEISAFDEDHVDVVVDFVDVGNNILVIEKFAKFDAIDPFTDAPASLSVSFRQVADDADTVSRIVITEEFLSNNTDLAWGGFREILMGKASFAQEQFKSFTIAPFTKRELLDGGKEAFFFGGVIEPGTTWNPGFGASGLQIDVNLTAGPVTFVLKEMPVIPAPGAAWLLALAGLLSRRAGRAPRRSG